MDGKRRLIEVALELKAGLIDKLLVFGIARNRRQLGGRVEGPNPFQIDIEETVGSREQAGSFRGSMLAQRDQKSDHARNQQNNDQDEKSASKAHRRSASTASSA